MLLLLNNVYKFYLRMGKQQFCRENYPQFLWSSGPVKHEYLRIKITISLPLFCLSLLNVAALCEVVLLPSPMDLNWELVDFFEGELLSAKEKSILLPFLQSFCCMNKHISLVVNE